MTTNAKLWAEVQDQLRAEKWGKEGWAKEAKARYVMLKEKCSKEQWGNLLRQLRSEFPDGFDSSYVIERCGKFQFPDDIRRKKTASTWSLYFNADLRNREGRDFGGLKLARERRAIIAQGHAYNTMFWWRVVDA